MATKKKVTKKSKKITKKSTIRKRTTKKAASITPNVRTITITPLTTPCTFGTDETGI